jgi:hypothetical protein
MALPPLPPSNTQRARYQYTTGPDQHFIEVRIADGTVLTVADAAVDALFTALTAQLYTITFVAAEVAAKGSNVYLPFTSAQTGKVYGSGTPAGQSRTWFYSLTGRSIASGRRVSARVYGAKNVGDATFRILTSEQTWADAAVNAMYNNPGQNWVAIDGAQTQWHTYLNLKQDDHMVKKLRGGG